MAITINPMSLQLAHYQNKVDERIEQWSRSNTISRIWNADSTVWIPESSDSTEQKELGNQLGWLKLPEQMLAQVEALEGFAAQIKSSKYTAVILLGMGGSSMAPEVFAKTFTAANGLPIYVLDSSNPDQIVALQERIADLSKTLFVVSSKSGSTIEVLSLCSYFYQLVSRETKLPGENFIAITDVHSTLHTLAEEKNFRHIFFGDPAVGGRYSALSHFGMVPAALTGADTAQLLQCASAMSKACRQPAASNPGLQLGAIIGELARAGRDKLTFFISPSISAFGAWVEQLIAESLGKNGVGVVAVVDEPVTDPCFYDQDRLFIYLRLHEDDNVALDQGIELLAGAGHPHVTIHIATLEDLGQEFFRWQMATASAAAVLGINPFDQPDVELAKKKASELMAEFETNGVLSGESAAQQYSDLEVYGSCHGETAADVLREFLLQAHSGDYLALMAYLPCDAATGSALMDLRLRLRDRMRIATTLGYGPRFLHSTGQLHKGDGNNGLFIQITHTPTNDLEIPGAKYSFATLLEAQAQGDYYALLQKKRRLIRFHIRAGVNSASAIRSLIHC